MAHHGIKRLFGAWRAQTTASKFNFSQQVNADRHKRGLNVRAQINLVKKGVNKKALLGEEFTPKFVEPRGKAWLRVAELSGL